jgi:raffinose/stachyose/melibiose transport system substrate-binding protein
MKIMKKAFALLLAAAMLATCLAGCKSSSAASGSQTSASSETKSYKGVTLKVLTHWTNLTAQGGGTGEYTVLDDFAKKFEDETGCTVEFTAITDYQTDVSTMLAGNDYGDVLDIVNSVANTDLHTYFEPLGNSTDDDLKNFINPDFKGTKNDDGSWQIYGLSYGMGVTGVVYNKSALAKVGYDEFPTTLDKFNDCCTKLAAAGIVPIGLNYNDKWPLGNWDILSTVAAKNGDYQNEMYKDSSPYDASKPYGISLSILNNIVKNGWCEKSLSTTNWENSKSDLGTGKDGMMLLGSWAVPQMQAKDTTANDIAIAAMPTDNSGKLYALESPDMCMCVSKNSANKELARKYLMEFVTSDFYNEEGFLPSRKDLPVTNQFLKDFVDSGVTLITNNPGETGDETSKRDAIAKEAGIDLNNGTYIQGVIDASRNKTFDAKIKELNQKWAAAQAEQDDE